MANENPNQVGNDHLEAVLLAMLDHPEQAEQIFDWTMSDDADQFFGENPIEPEPGHQQTSQAKAVKELLELHAAIWDLPIEQIPDENAILAKMKSADNVQVPETSKTQGTV